MKKRVEAEKNVDQDGKAFYELLNAYGQTMENLGNRVDVKLINNQKELLKWTSNPSFKILDI